MTSIFRINGRNLYLTYPQLSFELASITKEEILNRIKDKYNSDLNWCVIGQELHEDNNPHLHICIALHKKINYIGPSCLDWVVNKHGNYQIAKNILSVLKYCIKDNNYCEFNINTKEYIRKRLPLNQQAYIIIQEGGNIDDIDDKLPGYLLQHLNKVEYYIKYRERKRIRGTNTLWKGCYTISNNEKTIKIVKWLNDNIMKPRNFKQKQLYIQSTEHGKGKTSLINQLCEIIRVYPIPNEEHYYDLWEENCYDLIVFDEFLGQKKITFMNNILQGSRIMIPFKGGQRLKIKNIPIIICSNENPEYGYSKVPLHVIDAFKSRIEIVDEITEFIDIKIN